MNPFNDRVTGWTAIAAGTAALIGLVTLILFFATSSLIVGETSDYLGALSAMLIIPMLIAIGKIVMAKHEALGRSIILLGVLGVLIDLAQYVMFISGTMSFEESLKWNGTARGLIGIAVLAVGLLNRRNPELKPLYVWLSIVLGAVMAPGITAVTGFNPLADELNKLAQGGTLAGANPLLIVLALIMAPIFLLGWPSWLIWTGRLFLKGGLAIPESTVRASRLTGA